MSKYWQEINIGGLVIQTVNHQNKFLFHHRTHAQVHTHDCVRSPILKFIILTNIS
jgi:hypothetical protein